MLGAMNGETIRVPGDLPLVERACVRLVVRDVEGRVLLFHTRESTEAALGTWWELPGGGIDQGETYLEAAVRELREETGIAITPGDVGTPTWKRTATFRYRGKRHLQHEVVAEVRLAVPGPEVSAAERLYYEAEDYFGFRWWPADEIVASAERFYPGRLPALLTPFLSGEPIDEPFELWS
jgi:8-oxo-dGTP pyrophosphatase MutT (NUDIX family)